MVYNVHLKIVAQQDLNELWEISYGPKADLEWMKVNGPYFKDPVESWESFSSGYGQSLIEDPMARLIMLDEKIVGMVSAHFQDSSLKQWLEIGIVLYDANYWGQGFGTHALTQWLKILFNDFPYLPHIGFTTWSGNKGMQLLGEKVNMKKEGVIRQLRYWQGKYYDSVKYGILRDELN